MNRKDVITLLRSPAIRIDRHRGITITGTGALFVLALALKPDLLAAILERLHLLQ